jgi:tetratricopeptide (TPR) repeat protein
VQADPADARAQADLAYSCSRIADLLAEARKYSEALSYYRKGLTAVEKVAAVAPQQLPLRYGVIITRASIAEMEAKLGQRSWAVQEYSNALTALKLTPDDPIAAFRMWRAEAYYAIGNACAAVASSNGLPGDEARSDWRLAREMYQNSLDIYLELRRRGISTSEDASDKVTAEIAKCDAALAERE